MPRGELSFCVADTGVGIPADLLESIFEPFRQGDPSATRRFGGSGLGLAICRDVARLMHGDVRVESTLVPARASHSIFPCPLWCMRADRHCLPIKSRVRCYEPVPSRRRSLAALLQRLGCRVHFLDDLAAVSAAAARSPQEGRGDDIWLVAADSPEGPAVLRTVQAGWTGARVAILGKAASRSPVRII